MSSSHDDTGGAESNRTQASEFCLDDRELDAFVQFGDLPHDRLEHIAACSHCGTLISAAKSPPDIRSFLLGVKEERLPSPQPVAAVDDESSAVALLVRYTVPAVFLTAIAFFMFHQGESAKFVELETAHDAAIMQLQDQAVQITASANEIERLKTNLEQVAEASSAEYGILLASAQKQINSMQAALAKASGRVNVEDWSKEEIIAWMLSARIHVNESVIYLFNECARKGYREAIPKAVLFGSVRMRKGFEHCASARDLLNNYSNQEIESSLEEFAARMGDSAERLIDIFRKSEVMIRNN